MGVADLGLVVDGTRVEGLRSRGEGPPLVLVHGAGGNAAIWEPLARELSAFDLVAPSLPGRGGSLGDAFADVGEAAGWLARFLSAFGRPQPFVLGHSYGGALAIELALGGADLAGLILVASGARLRVHPGVLLAAEQAAKAGTPMPAGLAFVKVGAEARAAFEEASARTPPEAALRDWRACNAFDRMEDLPSISTPCLVMGGQADALTPPKYQRHLTAKMERSQLELVPSFGHLYPFEDPRGLAARVRAFVAAMP